MASKEEGGAGAMDPTVTPTELSGASVSGHETVKDKGRFTLYSEFRTLCESLQKAFPREKFKFPKKRFMGSNFDQDFLKGQFIQKLLGDPRLASSSQVMDFFFSTPRHGRGPKYKYDPKDSVEADTSEGGDEGGKDIIPFDLGTGESKKTKVTDFEMIKVIGKGSFGRVLLGKHIPTGDVFAVKVLSKAAIVKQNELYFVLDYVNGGELFFHLQRVKKFDVPRALFYAAEITSALGYMHSLNIVYRDLKPENILLDAVGHVVLTDFGLCKENVPVGGTTATFCGTPEYLAPEVLKKHAYGRPVDWWCLGCVTFEM
eukprot:gene16543-30924_t